MSPVLSVLGGVLLGALVTYLFQLVVLRESARNQFLDDAAQDLIRLEESSFDYWCASGLDDAGRERARAARLKSLVLHTEAFSEHGSKILGAQTWKKYSQLDVDLFKTATGGNFEVVGHEPDPERAVDVSYYCHHMRGIVRNARREVFKAR